MPRNNGVPSYESLLEFQEVYLRAIARAWQDEPFKHALVANPRQTLANSYGYVCPWNLKIEVKPASSSEYGWDDHRKSWKLPPIETSFGLPTAPVDLDEQLVAFAMYNDAGPCYLFTCC